MKNYLPTISFESFLYYGIYFFLLGSILLFAYRKSGLDQSAIKWRLLLGWLLFTGMSWLDAFFDFVPFLPDAAFYTAAIFEGNFPAEKLEGVQNFYSLTQVIKPIFFGMPMVVGLFACFFYFLAILFFQRSLAVLTETNLQGGDRAEAAHFQLFAALFPAALLYIPLLLRESLLLFGFALTVYGLLKLHRRNFDGFWLLPGLLLLCGLRTQNMIFVGGIVSVTLIWSIKWTASRKLLLLVGLGLAAFAAIAITGYVTPTELGEWRNRSVTKESLGEFTYGEVDWTSWWTLFATLPALIGQFILSPLPILDQNVPWETTWIFGDMLLVIALIAILIVRGRTFARHLRDNSSTQLWVGIMLIFVFMFGFYEYHLSGAVRHRMPFVLMLAVLVASLKHALSPKNAFPPSQ